MEEVNSYDELKKIIESKISGVNNLYLELPDLFITFELQVEWIESILRKGFTTQTNKETKTGICFRNCKFTKLDISNIPELNTVEINIIGGSIEELTIINSLFSDKIYINKQYGNNKEEIIINKLLIKDSVFKENFKLHNACVSEICIDDTDFEKHADFFKSSFKNGFLFENQVKSNICFKAINFRGLALFGDTKFEQKLIFQYVTFESYSHFRKAKLEKGLDLDYANIQNEMNFFDVQKLDEKEAKENTSQETYRIIKHNFEKIGNKIEANKYLALELEKKKIALENKKPREWLNYIVFKTHWLSSEFGTNWLKPLVYTLITSLITISFIHHSEVIKIISDPCLLNSDYIWKAIDKLFQYMYILNKNEKLVANSGVLIFNKTLLGYFYYQFLISIRKNTK